MASPRSSHKYLLRLLAAFLVTATLIPVAPAETAVAALPKPNLLGLATANFRTDLPQFTQRAGKSAAIFQLFWSLELGWASANNSWAAGILTELESLGSVGYIEVTTNNLGALNQGSKDADLRAMAKTVGDWIKAGNNRHILIAPLPEMNLTHAWGGNPAGFKSGYQRIRQAFVDQGLGPDQVRFVFAPNGTSDVGEYDDYYPGDSTVDIIGFARINRGTPWRSYNEVFQAHIDDMRARISLAKPILITQTGSVTSPGNRDVWLDQMFTNLKAHDQVIGAIYFNRDADHDYRVLENGALDPAFRSGYQGWSPPSEVEWIFDGRMDAWVRERTKMFPSSFTDIRGSIFRNAINWLAAEGITQGCNPPANTMFCPDDQVSRGQMAVFISRAQSFPAARGDHFSDDNGQFYESAANRLYEAGITVGCAPGRFCGEQQVSRGQMAAFLARLLGLPNTPTDHFVDDDGTFERAINRLATAGITNGCNPPANNRYCPADPVTRGEMAAFLRRALGP